MCGEPGRLLGLDLLNGRVGVGLRESEEDMTYASQQRARAFRRLNCVSERRRLRAVRYRLDLGELTFHSLFERGLIVAVLDLVERRRVKRECAFGEERIRPGGVSFRVLRNYRRRRRKHRGL